MSKDIFLYAAGDLKAELMESGKLQEKEKEEKAITHTSDCGLFLTIYCC